MRAMSSRLRPNWVCNTLRGPIRSSSQQLAPITQSQGSNQATQATLAAVRPLTVSCHR